MKRGRPRKVKPEESAGEQKRRRIKKESELDNDREIEAKHKIPRKHKKPEESQDKKKEKTKKFELPPLEVNEIFEYILKSIDRDPSLKSLIKSSYLKYKEIHAEISRRKNALLRSNYQETEYREEMNKLRADERAKMNELFEQSIEKLTAAQIRGFESIEALKKRYRLEQSKDKPKNLIAELLKTQAEPEEADPDLDPKGPLKDQLAKRRQDQQEILLKVFKSKIDFPEDDASFQRIEKAKFQFPSLKKIKSVPVEPGFPSFQRTPSLPPVELKLEPIKLEKVQLCSTLELDRVVANKMLAIQKGIDVYYEGSTKIKGGQQEQESTVHPCLKDYEKVKMERYQEMERNLKRPEDMAYDDLGFLIYLTSDCTNKLNQLRVTRTGDLKGLSIHPADLKRLIDRMLNI